MNFSVTSIPEANAHRSEFVEESGIRFLFKVVGQGLWRHLSAHRSFEVPRISPEPSGKCLEPQFPRRPSEPENVSEPPFLQNGLFQFPAPCGRANRRLLPPVRHLSTPR